MTDFVSVDVTDASSVGDVRRRFTELTRRLGFDETAAGRVAIIATELASNLVKHAGPGARVLGRAAERSDRIVLELLAVDTGPGIDNLGLALRDGYSSAATPGTGLGAVRRLADEFQIHSVAGAGTVVLARVGGPGADGRQGSSATPGVEFGVVAVPKPGEPVSGDGWALEHGPDRTWILMVDGLGHGAEAASASRAAIGAFRSATGRPPAEQVRTMHESLRRTRGAALAVAEIRHDEHQLLFAGIGNIAGAIVASEDTQRLVSHDGIAGHVAPRTQEFAYAWPAGALLILHSDGLSQRWDIARYPGLRFRDPSVVAAVLLRDNARGRDDATVLVARDSAHPAAGTADATV